MSEQASRYDYLAPRFPLAIAHRGGAGDWPENSLIAFQGAYELGFRYMETDVHLTADGQVVAFHDRTLNRLHGNPSLIRELEWQTINGLTLKDGGSVPLMQDLLEALPSAYFNIDMKSDEVVDPLIRLIEQQGAKQRVCLASFFDRRIRRVRNQLGPEVCVSSGRQAVALQVARSRGLPWPAVNAPVFQVPTHRFGVRVVTQSFVNRCHRDGKHVHVWTINDSSEMSQLLDLGVDGIVTDYPARLRTVLESKGLWDEQI